MIARKADNSQKWRTAQLPQEWLSSPEKVLPPKELLAPEEVPPPVELLQSEEFLPPEDGWAHPVTAPRTDKKKKKKFSLCSLASGHFFDLGASRIKQIERWIFVHLGKDTAIVALTFFLSKLLSNGLENSEYSKEDGNRHAERISVDAN